MSEHIPNRHLDSCRGLQDIPTAFPPFLSQRPYPILRDLSRLRAASVVGEACLPVGGGGKLRGVHSRRHQGKNAV